MIMKNARFAALLICVFLAGFAVASLIWAQGGEVGQIDEVVAAYQPEPEPEPQAEEPEPEPEIELEAEEPEPEASPLWCERDNITFDDMRADIMERGSYAFERASGRIVSFYDPDSILSTGRPFVLARGFSESPQSSVYVMFTYDPWRDVGWLVDAYNIGSWGGRWNTQPQLTRGLWEGRRYVEADTVTVHFFDAVDFGGGQTPTYTSADIAGDRLIEDFITLMYQNKGIELSDAWYIGNRLYANLINPEIFDGWGTSGEYSILRSLLMTLFSLPDTEEVVLLVFGDYGAWVGGHGMELGTSKRHERFEYP